MTDGEEALPGARSQTAVLYEAASKYAIYGVFIASAALIVATLLVGWINERTISVAAIAEAQRDNIALWCMDAMPFLFALWGQYASSRMAREAGDIISARTRVFREALEEAQHTNQAKTDFFARISHELRTPLNAIVGMADMLLEPSSAEEARWYAQTVRESAQNLLTLINDILDIAKIEAGHMELESIEFDLRECVRGAITLLHAQALRKGLKLTSLVAPDIPEYAIGDPGRLRQIIINLAGNAIKYTEEGEVVFTLSQDGDPESAGLGLRMEIADTGIGISPAGQRDLFKPYRQAGTGATRHGGTGLGLAITRELVESMHGKIGVKSQVGKGSTFWCTVQMRRGTQPQPLPAAALPDLEGKRVLLADPNEQSRQALADQIRSWGARVQAVGSSDDALAAVRIAGVKALPFHLIVLDMFLTEVNGEDLGQRFIADPDTDAAPVAIITSAGARGDVERMGREGFAAYLTRPIAAEDLKPLFRRILALRGMSPEERRRVGVITRYSLHEAPPAARHNRVLLVEDTEAGRIVSLRQLASIGVTADVAMTGAEAIEAAARTPYGVVLLDLQLPDMSGTQVLRRLRERAGTAEELPVVITTAGATDAEHKQCRELGANRIMTKPIDTRELRSVLARWVALDPEAPAAEGSPEEKAAGSQAIDPELARIFLGESDRRIVGIRNAPRDAAGTQRIANEAHSLRSTSHYVGDAATSLAAEQVERLARDGAASDELDAAVKALFAAYGKLRKRLRESLRAAPPA